MSRDYLQLSDDSIVTAGLHASRASSPYVKVGTACHAPWVGVDLSNNQM